MPVSAKWYGKAIDSAFRKKMDLSADTIKVMLCTSSYVPDQDTHDFKDDVTNEVSGTGYVAGGATLGTPTLTYTPATNTLAFDGGDVSWPSSTLTARYAVVYDSTPGTDATRPLIMYVDFGSDVSTTSGTLTITWDSAGLCSITVA
ncbi:hypothetical protein NDR87_31030 [Nocardia sp. CDC159]|uniref:Uncharacterized protein n=1 Tax=Nocardia pulmonis TaxID=2951408 RepID=A0A9X2J1E2_9NOCA|nr:MULTISPECIES: hypothetical protein [Nocardia]MCM6778015.1 hypothetical protein [Nocardia pulmonis]MCM6790814.1 hypothetical protein [Nocardia sp. CDC159]